MSVSWQSGPRIIKVSTTWDHRLPPANKSYAYNYNISLSTPYTAPRGVSGGGFKIYRDFPGSDNYISATASSLPVYSTGKRSGVRGGGGDLAYVTCDEEEVEGDNSNNRPSYPITRQQRPCGPKRTRNVRTRDPRKKYVPHASLSEAEAALLRALDNEKDNIASSTSQDDDDNSDVASTRSATEDDNDTCRDAKDAKVRFELKKLIILRRGLYLTAKEATFLDHLASTPGVPTEALEKTANVLRKCPLYNFPTDAHSCSDSNSLADTVCADESDDDDDSLVDDSDKCDANKEMDSRLADGDDDDVTTDTQTTATHRHVVRKAVRAASQSWRRKRSTLFQMDIWRRSRRQYDDDDTTPQMRSERHGIAYLFCCSSDHVSTTTFLPVKITDVGDDGETTAAAAEVADVFPLDDEDETLSLGSVVDFSILGTSAEDVASRPHVLSPPVMKVLRGEMPYMVQEDNYWMKYSLLRDGASLRILLQHVRNSLRTILAIETTEGEVFGAFVSSPWRYNGRNFYGSCEAFLWRLRSSRHSQCANLLHRFRMETDVEVFRWCPDNYSQNNRYIQLSNFNIIALGGDGDGFGLSLNSDLTEGTTSPCRTFNNPRLTRTTTTSGNADDRGTFTVANVEVWTMTPVDTVEQAEQLELARAFIVEHSEFVEG